MRYSDRAAAWARALTTPPPLSIFEHLTHDVPCGAGLRTGSLIWRRCVVRVGRDGADARGEPSGHSGQVPKSRGRSDPSVVYTPGLARRENPAWPGHGSPSGLRNFCCPRSRGPNLEKGEETKDRQNWLSTGEGRAGQRVPYSYTVAEYITPRPPRHLAVFACPWSLVHSLGFCLETSDSKNF